MIQQIAPVSRSISKTTGLNKGLVQARHIQARLKEEKPQVGFIAHPMTGRTFVVPILRWIE